MAVVTTPVVWKLAEGSGMTNSFIQDQDGSRKFHLEFDLAGFKPEEVSVRMTGNHLSVHAKQEIVDGNKTTHREFSRNYTLPNEVKSELLTSKLNESGKLTIEAPLPALPGNTEKIISTNFGNEASQRTNTIIKKQETTNTLIQTQDDGSRKFHLELDMAGFKPEDISVKMTGNHLAVHAKQDIVDGNRTTHREFNRQYTLPTEVQSELLTSKLSDSGQLTVEAPLSALPGNTEKLISIDFGK